VRDLDIAIEWLRTQPAGAGVVGPLQQRRDRVWRRQRLQVIRPPARLLSALAAPRKPGRAGGVARRFRKLARRYRAELRAVLPRFEKLTEEQRHEFRRTVRWWRYLRELDVAKGKPAGDAAIRRLLPAQEALGEVQNLALVQAVVEALPPSSGREGLLAVLARQQQAQRDAVVRALAALGRWLR
jgi:CHAD domain-containing protein